jgi:hypothetical protein
MMEDAALARVCFCVVGWWVSLMCLSHLAFVVIQTSQDAPPARAYCTNQRMHASQDLEFTVYRLDSEYTHFHPICIIPLTYITYVREHTNCSPKHPIIY